MNKIGKVGNFFQGPYEMITIAVQVNDLIHNHEILYYQNELDDEDPNQGYQREPKQPRIKRFAAKIERTVNSKNFIPMPTALILSDRDVNYKFSNGSVDIIDGKFKLIDGQHRVLAYKRAIEELKCDSLKTHYIPCTILKINDLKMTDKEKFELEVKEFITINGEAKSVPVNLGTELLVQLYQGGRLKNDEFNDVKIMAAQLVKRLNEECKPWKDKLIVANQSTYKKKDWGINNEFKHKRVMSNKSLMDALELVIKYFDEFIFKPNEPRDSKMDTLYMVLDNYWTVINDSMPEAISKARNHVLQKSVGIFSFHHLLIEIVKLIRSPENQGYVSDKKEYEKILSSETLEFMDSSWWSNDNKNPGYASKFGNRKGFKVLSKEMYAQIDESLNEEDGSSITKY